MKCPAIAVSFCLTFLLLAHCGSGSKATVSTSPSATGQSSPSQSPAANKPASETSGSARASAATDVVMASGALQKCLGITPGASRMTNAGKSQFCEQLPGASFYDQAGARFQAGDHAGAAQIVRKAADAGNALAQLRLALLYDQGDGVPQNSRTAFEWYTKAAALGEPESQNQLGNNYEGGDFVEENWDLSARLRQASAEQGWMKGQFSLGRAYQFGIGVPQNRQQAIEWFQKAGAQGHPDGNYWAQWLSDSTNNIGFRDDVERSIVMDVAGRMRFSGVLMGGDPYGITFHNSAQRALWLGGQRQNADRDEADTLAKIRKAQRKECLDAHRYGCA
ncbi:MAG TPA: tetratricopeptide repeat protein [Bryobacteraceae bacterium]